MNSFSDLRQIRQILERANAPSEPRWYERAYARLQVFVKYVGVPALLLAAIIPVYEACRRYVEYRKQQSIQGTCADYAWTLLKAGEPQRAMAVLASLRDTGNYDAHTQYLRARILADTAIRQARQQQEAEDTINLLLLLHKNRSWFLGPLGSPRDILELRLGLVDISIQLTQARKAQALLRAIRASPDLMNQSLADAEVKLRAGKAHILLHETKLAEAPLLSAVRQFTRAGRSESAAEASFALGNLYATLNRSVDARKEYAVAEQNYTSRGDTFGLTRVTNNLANLSMRDQDLVRARYFFEREQTFARETGDNRGLARALVGLAAVSRNEGRLDESITLATEAVEAYRQQSDNAGLASAYQNLANTYVRQPNYPQALYFGKRALIMFEELRDITGVARTMGVLSRAALELQYDDDAATYTLGVITLNRFVGYERTSYGERDRLAQLNDLRSFKAKAGPAFDAHMAHAQMELRRIADQMRIETLDVSVPDV